MRVLITPDTSTAAAVVDHLAQWSAAGVLRPLCWWPSAVDAKAVGGAQVRLLERGATQEVSLAVALQHVDPAEIALIAFYPAKADEEIDVGFEGTVGRCLAAAVDVLAFDARRPAECTMVIAPARIGQTVPAGLYRAQWAANLYVAPEDRSGPGSPNHLADNDVLLPAHAAHAIATIADLWNGASETRGVLTRLRERQPHIAPAQVQVVRCYTRALDYGYLADHVSAGAFEPAPAWPNPEPRRLDRVIDAAPLMPHLVRAFMERHRDVLDVSPFEPLVLDPPSKYGLVEAIVLVWREFVAWLKRKPFDWAEEQLAAVHDAAAARIERLSDLTVKRWSDYGPAERELLDLREHLERPLLVADGPVARTWTELRGLAFGLVDGSALPADLEGIAMVSGEKRALVPEPAAIVPAPSGLTPTAEADGSARACDPLNTAEEPGEPVPLVWSVGAAIVEAMQRAEREAEAPVAETPAEPEPPARRRRGKLALIGSAAVAAVAGVAAWTNLSGVGRTAVLVVIVLLWFAYLLRRVHEANKRRERERLAALERQLATLNAAMLKAQREGDRRRLTRRYGEYLDWAEIIGWIVHRPWTGHPLHRLDLVRSIESEALPAAVRLAVGQFSETRIEQLANQARARLFTRAWMLNLYEDVERRSMDDYLQARGILDDAEAEAERLDPSADTARDDDSPRRQLLEATRRGDHRSVARNDFAGELLVYLDRRPLDSLAERAIVVASIGDPGGDMTARPLPPSAAWFEAPPEIAEMASQLRQSVVKVEAQTPRGLFAATGLAVGAEALIATSYRGLDAAGAISVILPGGTRINASIERSWPLMDLALLSLKGVHDLLSAALAPSDAVVEHGQPVFCLGYDAREEQPSLTWGLIAAAARMLFPGGANLVDVVQATFRRHRGTPGAPIIDTDGRVVAIQRASDPARGRIAGYLSNATPVDALHRLLAGPQASEAAPPSASVSPRRALSEQLHPTPSRFLADLFDQDDDVSLLPQHWVDSDGHHNVRDVIAVPDRQGLRPNQPDPVQHTSHFLEPLRVLVHRIELTEPVEVEALVSCARAPDRL